MDIGNIMLDQNSFNNIVKGEILNMTPKKIKSQLYNAVDDAITALRNN